ncbi:hypothetical protein LARV_02851 [Longilinea arvoryzae]|uniref:Uncharacterized protein n=1 Tax=Longilinea arvoryzae TaxID=360412 RepID=A0A0S7BBB8_9CHLR|nr:hypothetical protein [Longilinea arvoryzae]GAP15071.1 hypothetical protein LARV_02851 [Longilinea arvoryzae]
MLNRTWQFTLDNISHQVILNFSLSHHYRLQFDGKTIFQKSILKTIEHYQTLEIPGHQVEIGIIPGVFSNEVYLRVDDEFISPLGNRKYKIGKETKKRFDNLENWRNLANTLGFNFYANPNIDPALRFRLVGHFFNLLVIIFPGLKNYRNTILPGVFVGIQHASMIEEQIKSVNKSEDLIQFQKKLKIAKDEFEISSTMTVLFIPDIRKRTTSQRAQVIKDFLSLMARYLKPGMEKCEGLECKKGLKEPLHLVFINMIPYLMCSDCISQITEIGKRKKAEYEKQPTNLKIGIINGCMTGLLCAIGGGMLIAFVQKLGFALWSAFSVFLVFMLVNNVIVKALTKWTNFSMLASLIITELSIYLGIFLGSVGEVILGQQFSFSWNEILERFLEFLNTPEFLSINITFIIFLIIPLSIYNSINHSKSVTRAFSPDVEVITDL